MFPYTRFDCLSTTFPNTDDLRDIYFMFTPLDPAVNLSFEYELLILNSENYLVFLESNKLFKIITKLWKQVQDMINAPRSVITPNLLKIRKEATGILGACLKCLFLNRETVNYTEVKNRLSIPLKSLENSIIPLTELNENLIRRMIYEEQHECSITYAYQHMYLDVQWLLLCILYLYNASNDEIRNHLQFIMKDLLKISHVIFKTNNFSKSESGASFACPCIKRMWLKIQLFIEKSNFSNTFWEILDQLLENEEMFTLRLLVDIASLQGIDDRMQLLGPSCYRITANFPLLEKQLQSFLAKPFNYQQLLIFLKHSDKLVNYWWKEYSKIDFYQILWDYFNKNINVSFTNDEVMPKTVEQFMTIIDQLSNEQECPNCLSCYEFFLHMLAKHLSCNPNQWHRLKGRIYSRLPLHKINEFNENGLYHIIILFLSLYKSIDLNEITSKLLSLLENLSADRQNSYLVWNTYLVLIVIHDRKKIPSEKIAEPLLRLVESAADNRNQFHLLKLFIDGLNYTFKLCEMPQGKNVLLTNWVFKYMMHCQQSELNNLINILCETIRKIHETDEWSEWENVFKTNVLPGLKQIASTSGVPTQVGELVALICQRNGDLSNDCLQQFTEETIMPKVTSQFLVFYLKDYCDIQVLPKNQELIIIQAWVRCSLLMPQFNENLTKKVLKLSTIASYINKDITSNCDSLCSFIKNIGAQISPNLNNNRLKEICEICFSQADRWIEKYLLKPNTEDLILHIYTTFGILFYHCSLVLYHKAKSNCLLSRLVSLLLLPTNFLKGKAPHNYILAAIQRTWHLFMQGIFQLNHENDRYIDRLMKDLIVRYLPHLPVPTSPMIKCLENDQMCSFIIEKICLGFLSSTSKSSEDNTSKALKLITVTIQNSSHNRQVELVIKKSLPYILEVIMFHAHKTSALELFKLIVFSKHYVNIKDILRHSIITVTEKHLAFNVNNTFQLLSVLSKLIPLDVQAVMPNVKKQVSTVEKMRGVGFDNILRRNLDNIEKLLAN